MQSISTPGFSYRKKIPLTSSPKGSRQDREDLSLTDLFTVALKKLVREYEEKNGTVRVRKQKKKDLSDVFDI